MFNTEGLPGAPEARHNLISDHQDVVPLTDLSDPSHVLIGRKDQSTGTENWLHDEGRDGIRSLHGDEIFQRIGANTRAVGILGSRRAPVIARGLDAQEPWSQGSRSLTMCSARSAHCAKGHAVESLPQRDNFDLPTVATEIVIPPRELECLLIRL